MSRILIIEDEETIADLEKDYLELSDFEVKIEHTGDAGLKTALEEDFDLVILDLMLPGMDGFEVCKKIREVKDLPILMVSAKKDDIDKILDGEADEDSCAAESYGNGDWTLCELYEERANLQYKVISECMETFNHMAEKSDK